MQRTRNGSTGASPLNSVFDGRELPGVLAYGASASEAQARVQALALRVVADRLEHGEAGPDLIDISFNAA